MAHILDYQDYVLDALEAVEFKLVRRKEDLEDDSLAFNPGMAHQIFGEAENIFGYQDLRVNILYSAGPLHIYLGTEYSKKVDAVSQGDIKADNVVAAIAEKLPDGCYFMNMDEFLKTLDRAEKFQPFGKKLSEHIHVNEDGSERLFEFYYSDYNSPAFMKFFERLQTFILWFVDAASYIDVDDPQWRYLVCYEKYKNDDGNYQYATVGYTTIYQYYAYPQHIRPRISQMLVLPPFQKLGIGTKFLKTIYDNYQSDKTVVDITVEDPSDEFKRMRNYMDARLCMNLKSFNKEQITKGFNKEMAREAREMFKITPRQARKIYEILRLYHTNVADEADYVPYRLDVKRRLNSVYYKQISDIKKLEKQNMDTEWLRASLPNKQQRCEQLQSEFEQVELEYQEIIKKLRNYV